MAESNSPQGLEAFFRRRPFRPFAVELVSGNRFTVDRPEALAIRGGVSIYIDQDGKYTLFDNSGVSRITEAPDQTSASA